MAQNKSFGRARQEVEQRRKSFQMRNKSKAFTSRQSHTSASYADLYLTFSEFAMRRMAPVAAVIYAFTFLFFVSWVVVGSKEQIDSFNLDLGGNTQFAQSVFYIPEGDKLYQFELSQTFMTQAIPQYSELEVELVAENYDHVYSFYKDLWMEKYQDEDGYGMKTYSDLGMQFMIEFSNPGYYFLRGWSHNGNNGMISGKVYKVSGGNLYFFIYSIVYGALCVILIIFSPRWGNPITMISSIPRIRSIRKNRRFWFVLVVSTLLYAFSVVVTMNHYGYAKCGKDTVLPTFLFQTKEVYYLG